MMTNTLKPFEGKTVMQSYKVTMARHELSVVEMRIMAIVIYKLKEAQISGYNEDVRKMRDLFEKYNRIKIKNADLVVSDNYAEVRRALKSLTQRPIELKKNKGTYFFNLVREAYYSDDRTEIEVDISPNILPELIEIGHNYTKFGLNFLFQTKSAHTIRWYQIASHWVRQGWFYISKDDIRELFKIGNRYELHKNFQTRLITEPFAEINEKSDIQIEIKETRKEGRTIVGYTIAVMRKEINLERENI